MTSECVMAVFIFTMVLASVFLIWDTTSASILRSEILHDMSSMSNGAIEMLVRTPGTPCDWEDYPAEELSSLGLSGDSRVLEPDKLFRFIDLMADETDSNTSNNPCYDPVSSPDVTKYECNRYLLGLKKYDFSLEVFGLDGGLVSLQGVNCSTGRAPSGDDFLLTQKRSALLNGEVVGLELKVWA